MSRHSFSKQDIPPVFQCTTKDGKERLFPYPNQHIYPLKKIERKNEILEINEQTSTLITTSLSIESIEDSMLTESCDTNDTE